VWVKKALDIITQVEEQTCDVYATLTPPENFDVENAAQVAHMCVLVQMAAEHIDSAGQSLKLVQHQEPQVIDRKKMIVSLLKEMDIQMSFLNATLPLLPPKTTPVFFDAGMLLNTLGI
jgi:hypothetical protein